MQAITAGTSAIPADQVRGHPTFIEEDVLAHIAQREPLAPAPALSGDVGPVLFVGVYRFC